MARRLLPLAAALALSGCEWFTDFKDQPRIEPWEAYAVGVDSAGMDTVAFRGQPAGSVPTTDAGPPAFLVSYAPLPATIDSMSGLPNPVAADARSLERGRKYYQINCAVCHGDLGDGRGPATLYGMVPMSLVSDRVRGFSDGYIYGIIRNGRGLMPSYARIEHMDRWDVVNYIRGLQAGTVPTGPVGQPGETGATLPGATHLAPTRPAPFYNPRGAQSAPTPPDTTGPSRS